MKSGFQFHLLHNPPPLSSPNSEKLFPKLPPPLITAQTHHPRKRATGHRARQKPVAFNSIRDPVPAFFLKNRQYLTPRRVGGKRAIFLSLETCHPQMMINNDFELEKEMIPNAVLSEGEKHSLEEEEGDWVKLIEGSFSANVLTILWEMASKNR